jgi:hypothetical protein
MIRVARWKLLATFAALFVLGVWSGRADVSARSTHYPAVLICPRLAEDSAAHVKLVEYGSGRIVYRCQREGY